MQGFEFVPLGLPDVWLIKNFHAGDNRGGFTKIFERGIFLSHGVTFTADEVFASVSAKNVVRGLHFQTHRPQAKLVAVLSGEVWDVAVDLRPKSRTFGKWVGVGLSAENHHALYIPRGLPPFRMARSCFTSVRGHMTGKRTRESGLMTRGLQSPGRWGRGMPSIRRGIWV